MKALPIMLLVLLAIACSKPTEQTTSTADSTAATATVQDPSEQPVNVVIWNEVGIRDTPSEKGKYLTSIYLSEQFDITGDTASEMSGSKRIHYHKIKLSDGTVGWVHDEFVAIHVRPAVATQEEAVYKRPDMAAITEKTFKRGDFVVVRKVEGQFVEVTGKPIGDKWFTSGFIKEDNLSYYNDDVKYAATMRRAAEETKEKIKATLQAELDNQDLFGESFLWQADHGFPGQMDMPAREQRKNHPMKEKPLQQVPGIEGRLTSELTKTVSSAIIRSIVLRRKTSAVTGTTVPRRT